MSKLSEALAEVSKFLEAFEQNPGGRILTVQQPTTVFIECENDTIEDFTCVSLVFVGSDLLVRIR